MLVVNNICIFIEPALDLSPQSLYTTSSCIIGKHNHRWIDRRKIIL